MPVSPDTHVATIFAVLRKSYDTRHNIPRHMRRAFDVAERLLTGGHPGRVVEEILALAADETLVTLPKEYAWINYNTLPLLMEFVAPLMLGDTWVTEEINQGDDLARLISPRLVCHDVDAPLQPAAKMLAHLRQLSDVLAEYRQREEAAKAAGKKITHTALQVHWRQEAYVFESFCYTEVCVKA